VPVRLSDADAHEHADQHADASAGLHEYADPDGLTHAHAGAADQHAHEHRDEHPRAADEHPGSTHEHPDRHGDQHAGAADEYADHYDNRYTGSAHEHADQHAGAADDDSDRNRPAEPDRHPGLAHSDARLVTHASERTRGAWDNSLPAHGA